MEKFKIINYNADGQTEIKEVEGEQIMIAGIPCFIFDEADRDKWGDLTNYNISHLETGMCCAVKLDKNEAIEKAKNNFKLYPHAIQKAREKLISLGITLPLNT